MARRFRRLRRAASQVIEVTRRFWRFCHCCGTVRAGFMKDVIPVSVALSCTSLPRARAPVFCCHLSAKGSTQSPCVSTHSCDSSSIGPQNWTRPTDSGTAEAHPFIQGPYIPGSFSSDYQVTPSGISFANSVHQSHELQRDYRNMVSQLWRSPSQSFCGAPVPIWSVSGSGQTNDHVPSRFRQQPQSVLNPVYRVEKEPSSSNGTSRNSWSSHSEIMKVLDYEFDEPSQANRSTSSGVNRQSHYINCGTTLMTPVEISYTSCRHGERFERNRMNLNYVPNRRTTDRQPSNMTLLNGVTLNAETNLTFVRSKVADIVEVAEKSPIVNDDPSSTIVLPGCSQVDPELRLNLNLLNDSSTGIVISPDIWVEYARKSDWYAIDPGNWHHKQTIARTKCGSVTVAFCDKFRQKFVLKTLPTEDYNTEVKILLQCQCPFVAEMQAVLKQSSDKLLCMTYYERLDLAYWLRKDQNREFFTEKDATLISSYILTGLEFIHNKGYLHLDIKPANVLLCNKAYPVLGDFGSARSVEDTSGQFRRYTPSYASPEILRGETPTNQADLWSTACMFYEVVVGRSPYKCSTKAETELKVLATATPDVSMLSLDAQHFICSQFKSDMNDRLGFSFGARETTRHRIFHSMDWERIKYSHRHSDCRLLRVLQAIDQNDKEPSESSSSSVCVNNNSSRWELWSSSSSEGSDEEFSFSQRVIYTLEEEDEENDETEGPTNHEDGEKVDSYGGKDGPFDLDNADDDDGG